MDTVYNESNVEAISDFFCGSGHVIPKHVHICHENNKMHLNVERVQVNFLMTLNHLPPK